MSPQWICTHPDLRVGCGSWPFALVPIAGPLASGLTAFGYGSRRDFSAFWADIPLLTMQIVGFALLLYAIGAPTLEISEGFAIGGSARLRVELGAPSAQFGVTAALDF